MEPSTGSRREGLFQVALYILLFLLFFQLVSDFVEAIYVFGLLGTSIPVEIVSVLFFLSPLVLLMPKRGLSGWPLVVVGELMLLCRIAEALLDTRGKMLVAGVGTACFLILLPSMLRSRQDRDGGPIGPILGLGLAGALSLSVLFRSLGSGSDISTCGGTQAIGWLLAMAAGVLLPILHRRGQSAPASGDTPAQRLCLGRTLGLCLGLVGVLVVCYFAFTSPGVIARWTGMSYLLVVSVVALVLCLFILVLALRPGLLAGLSRGVILLWNGLFCLALALTILAHQVRFPASASGYPLPESAVPWFHHVPLFLLLLLFPVILVDLVLFVQEIVAGRPAPRALAAGFSLAGLYLLLIVFAQVFTTVYDYIPVIGPFLRDRFWLVFLVAGLVAALPVLLVRRGSLGTLRAGGRPALAWGLPAAAVLIALGTIAGALLTAARPAAPSQPQTTLKFLTYNIQQGYSKAGRWDYDGQLDVIRWVNADIVGLQECDTARIANGNGDVVRYFADRLDLYSYYGPKTVPGTFGIALLSKYPIENPRTFYMYSEGEQTAAIEAQIQVGGRTFDVFVTHLGNGGPIVQQEAILQEVEGKENVILVGDFNFRPDSDQYRLTTGVLADSWLLKWPQGNSSQGVDPARMIDHIFVSPGTEVTDSTFLPGPGSDHPALTTTIEW